MAYRPALAIRKRRKRAIWRILGLGSSLSAVDTANLIEMFILLLSAESWLLGNGKYQA